MREAFMRDGHWRGELWQRRKDGEEFLCWLEISVVHDAVGERTHFVGVMSDITDRKRAEQELRYLANYDTMTGLPNRALLSERLGQAILRGRHSGRRVAVLFLDLDRFKHVNDSMGHAAGDRMLRAAGARLRACIAPTDTVARLGGDEFTVVLENLVHVQQAEDVAQKLLEAFVVPLHLDSGEDVVISPSIGISVFPDHGQDPGELLKSADTAMYQAKDRGRNTYMFYTAEMDADARSRAGLIAALRRGLERNEFHVVYQPKLSLVENRVTGVEALLRWNSEELGSVSPATFIPLAEETGLIVPIGEYVLNAACAQLRRWHDQGFTRLKIAVNLSMLQLLRAELTVRLRQILDTHGLRAGAPRTRADRDHGHGQRRAIGAHAERTQGDRRHAGDRRFRHRLFVAELPQAAADRHAEDRPGVRRRHHHRSGRRGDHLDDHHDGALARPRRRRRRRGNPRAAALPAQPGLRRNPGPLVRAAARGGRLLHLPDRCSRTAAPAGSWPRSG